MNTLSNFQPVKTASAYACQHLSASARIFLHAYQLPPTPVSTSPCQYLYPYSFSLSHALMPMAYFQ